MIGLPGFAALAAGPGLDRPPPEPSALRRRMAELYGAPEARVLPTRGVAHALELALRAARRAGARTVACDEAGAALAQLLRRCDLDSDPASADLRLMRSPDAPWGRLLDPRRARELAAAIAPGWLVVDESGVEFAAAPSLAPLTAEIPNLVVLRSLELAYGLPGAPCGAAIAAPELIACLAAESEPGPLSGPTLAAAEAVLSPSRALAVAGRVALVRAERDRLRAALAAAPAVRHVEAGEGPWLYLECADDRAGEIARFGAAVWPVASGYGLAVGDTEANGRALAAFGAEPGRAPRRRGEAVRDTRETRISAVVDLDRAGDTAIRTGVGFFDHMLEQVAAHGGVSIRLACDGDLGVDPHHTVEDSALALGAALRQALGERAGVGRYGFVTPMDEAEAAVSLDLSGRPFAVFEGEFAAERIGDYPTALTAHVFRSLADSLGAAIHVRVTGQDDHHKTEACFKAFGRALRQAVRLEGGGVPSTKGVL